VKRRVLAVAQLRVQVLAAEALAKLYHALFVPFLCKRVV
jgi:hypothetical protein